MTRSQATPASSQMITMERMLQEKDDEIERLRKDAERYRMLRRGQHWSVIDGIGDTLIADGLDAAIDATMLKTPNVQIEPPSRLFAKVRSTVGLGLDAGQGNGD